MHQMNHLDCEVSDEVFPFLRISIRCCWYVKVQDKPVCVPSHVKWREDVPRKTCTRLDICCPRCCESVVVLPLEDQNPISSSRLHRKNKRDDNSEQSPCRRPRNRYPQRPLLFVQGERSRDDRPRYNTAAVVLIICISYVCCILCVLITCCVYWYVVSECVSISCCEHVYIYIMLWVCVRSCVCKSIGSMLWERESACV